MVIILAETNNTNGKALASMILGIVGFIMVFTGYGAFNGNRLGGGGQGLSARS